MEELGSTLQELSLHYKYAFTSLHIMLVHLVHGR